jgi:hypothetical protein
VPYGKQIAGWVADRYPNANPRQARIMVDKAIRATDGSEARVVKHLACYFPELAEPRGATLHAVDGGGEGSGQDRQPPLLAQAKPPPRARPAIHPATGVAAEAAS